MRTAAFTAIINDRNEVLLVRSLTLSRYHGAWDIPGGLVEPGEDPADAAVREALEETGITCSTNRLLDTIYIAEDKTESYIYLGTYVSGDIVVQTSEIAEARWFTLSEAVTLPLAYNTADILRQLQSNI